jgi:hypothetical protein
MSIAASLPKWTSGSCSWTKKSSASGQDWYGIDELLSEADEAVMLGMFLDTGDIRHLAAQKEIEEQFEKDQVDSSAMACVIPCAPNVLLLAVDT